MRSAVVSSRSAGGRLVALLWALVLAAATLVAGPVTTAQAAPLPATYTATASGDVLTLGATAGTTTLATADLVHAAASLDSSDPTEPASAASANLGAQVGPLGAQLNSSRVIAPPDASDSGSLVTASGEGLSTGVLTYSDSATWVSATACVADGTDISSATTTTAGAEFGLPIGDVIVTGEASVTGTTSLDQVSPTNDTRAVVATSTGSLSDISIAEGLATVAVTSDPTLTATATGTASGSGVAFTPAQATVTIGGTTTTLTAGVDTTLALPAGAGSVTFHLASSSEITNLVVAGDGTSASGDAAPLTAEITLANAPGLVTDAALLTLHAEATAPAGGVECDWTPTITIATPADGSTTTDTTPDITGTSNVTNGTIQLSLDSGTPIDVPTDANGAFSYTPTTPLTEGPHAVTATAADPGGGDPATDTSNFTVDTTAPIVAISTPPDGSTTGDTTPDVTGTSDILNGQITLSIDGGDPITVPTDASGTFSYTPTTPLTEGPHTVEATATDAAGNSATDTSSFTVTPGVPVVDITDPADGSTTSDPTPDITGTTDQPNSTVAIVIDGGDPIEVDTDADGNFSYTPTSELSCGQHQVTVSAQNGTGTGSDSTTFTLACGAGGTDGTGGANSNGAGSGGLLSYTGSNVAAVLAAGALLIGLGSALVMASPAARRRREASTDGTLR